MKMGPFWGWFVRGPVRSGWLVGPVQKYGSSVVFISNGADDECGVRKHKIHNRVLYLYRSNDLTLSR